MFKALHFGSMPMPMYSAKQNDFLAFKASENVGMPKKLIRVENSLMSLPGDDLGHQTQVQACGSLLRGTAIAQEHRGSLLHLGDAQSFFAPAQFIKEYIACPLGSPPLHLLDCDGESGSGKISHEPSTDPERVAYEGTQQRR